MGWVIEPHFVALVVACAISQSVITSFDPVIGRHNCGCHVDGALNFLHDWIGFGLLIVVGCPKQ
jgi:putative Mn2+ efflux pump MntP